MEHLEQMELQLLEQCREITTLVQCFAWLQRCEECIEQLEELSRAKRPRLTVGHRQSVVAKIARLASEKTLLERRFVHVGDYAGTSDNAERLVWREIDTAFKSRVLTGAVINSKHIEPRQFLEDVREIVFNQVRETIEKHGSVKMNTVFNGEFTNFRGERNNKNVTTKNYELYRISNLHEWYEQHVIKITLTMLDEFQERDSGWALSRILNLTVNINKLNPMLAGCDIALPREIMLKKAVINVKSKDNACFAWSVVTVLYQAELHVNRTSSYPYYATVLNFDGIEFLVMLKDIKKFERGNSVSINVYSGQKEEKRLTVLPIRLTDDEKERHVNLRGRSTRQKSRPLCMDQKSISSCELTIKQEK
ncbi:uncharacterized protein LOC105206891 [Solenopsis invicta]|uniref:uncharacterized protein LOC105206891 n=1 Tax=Solenopsis invicta TaxID=13686 RepID=UPI00193D668A|nr:uncharacterized protein LOC105206891 [Solenopsis invicta]